MKETRENNIFYVLMLVAVLAIYTKTKEINDKAKETSRTKKGSGYNIYK